jgi:predicted NUDIX family phosphoesterase
MPKKKEIQAPVATIDKETLKAKYGDKTVMVVPSNIAFHNGTPLFNEGFTPYETISTISIPIPTVIPEAKGITTTIRTAIRLSMTPMLRYEAECNPSFKQVIPYVVLRYEDKVFATHRLAGDPRLTSMYSIGTGGHVDGGEQLYDAMYRELDEEVDLKADNIVSNNFVGFIYSTATEVDSVHLGMVFECSVDTSSKVVVLEKEKLEGEWITKEKLDALYSQGKLESWSKIVYESYLKRRM